MCRTSVGAQQEPESEWINKLLTDGSDVSPRTEEMSDEERRRNSSWNRWEEKSAERMAAGGHKTGKLRGDENNHGERGNGNQGWQRRKETEEGEFGTEGEGRGERCFNRGDSLSHGRLQETEAVKVGATVVELRDNHLQACWQAVFHHLVSDSD